MNKVYITTYCEWNSYGSILQAMALKETLRSLGYESEILKVGSAPRKELTRGKVDCSGPKQIVSSVHKRLIHSKLEDRYLRTVEFINRNVDIRYFALYENLKANFPEAQAYIAGSDQIWHPHNCTPQFFLDFLPKRIRKISYAASMGDVRIPKEKAGVFQDLVQNFDFYSVREADNIPVVQEFVNKDIHVHIDPTFLCEANFWRLHEREYSMKKPYILVYAIYWDAALNKELIKLHKETGYEIVSIAGGLQKVYANRYIYDADPAQFLWLVDHAEAVVSSSFHGVALATIFNKHLSAVINPMLPSRIGCLMDTLGLEKKSVLDVLRKGENYAEVNEKISSERNRSISYLRMVLAG